ncbi:MAG: peptidase S41 [Haliea sp.]|jgi:carboxyl-terminal processing protease|nr:peptidase S41 [Haliea sp.]|tara:strand:- start:1461 stop:3575 length:2115 start_codon:yes stop_codon:yes gene_type:complete
MTQFARVIRASVRPCALLLSLALLLPASLLQAAIEHTESQRQTIVEMIEQLEERHYAQLIYDDELSSRHLDNYIDALDPGKMFFIRGDLESFEEYRLAMDDDLHAGQLDAGFTIFNRFQERLEARLQSVLDALPAQVAAMDFSIDENYVLDDEARDWASNGAELDERWRLHLKNQVLSLRLAEKPEEEIVPTLEKRYRNQLKRVQQYNSQDVFQVYANALTELYDPHTNYLSPRRSENFNINMSLSLEGIGAVLQLEDEYTRVARLVAAGPADKQGELRPSDRIVAVAQGEGGEFEDVIGWRLDEVVELIRGPKGSTVRLQVIPAGATADVRRDITIVRNEVKLEEQSAQKEIIEVPGADGETLRLGVIDIPAFYIDFEAMRRGDDDYRSTTRDVRRLLDELEAEGIDGLIVDLRHNGGGSLQEANELTGLFIEYGPTVQIRHASRRVWRDGKRLRSPYYDGPLAVIINRLSASASEIFAGAIQDYERGVVVGDRSFGKGTVQTMIPLTEGQLKLTESKFYRISGESTQHRGVVPDVVFPSLFDPEEIGESALEHALPWDQINPVRHRRYGNVRSMAPKLREMFETRSSDNPDLRYLQEQVALAEDTRDLQALPLNLTERLALRDEQEKRALAIENRLRKARGEPLLTKLEAEPEEESAAAEERDGGDAAESDVLLTEAGNILADVMLMERQAYAQRNGISEAR